MWIESTNIGDEKYTGRIFKAVDPFSLLGSLTSHVHHSEDPFECLHI